MSVIVPKIFDEQPPQPDAKAQAEAVAISSGKLKRDESFRKHVHLGSLVLFWFAILAIICMASVWLFNVLTPVKWHFLEATQKSELQNLIIAAITSSFVTNHVKRIMEKTQD